MSYVARKEVKKVLKKNADESELNKAGLDEQHDRDSSRDHDIPENRGEQVLENDRNQPHARSFEVEDDTSVMNKNRQPQEVRSYVTS